MERLTRILHIHSCRYYTANERLYACESVVRHDGTVIDQWVDLTNYTVPQLMLWLGY